MHHDWHCHDWHYAYIKQLAEAMGKEWVQCEKCCGTRLWGPPDDSSENLECPRCFGAGEVLK